MNKKLIAVALIALELASFRPTEAKESEGEIIDGPNKKYIQMLFGEKTKKVKKVNKITNYDINKNIKFNIIRANFAKCLMTQRISSKYGVNELLIEYAFDEAKNYCNKDNTMRYYYSIVSLILATMEVESNFKNITCVNTDGSIDYGIMQVNTSIIPDIRKKLGNSVSNLEYNTRQNIKAGTCEVMMCYKKALTNHSSNPIFWHYAYYNRGLYFEKFSYSYNDMYKRSAKFIDKYNKYFNMMP